MAKAAATTSPATDLGDELEKLFGKNDATTDEAGFLPTGFLPLNHALSGRYEDGGIPRGRITEISGPPSAGKTSLVTDIMIAVQRAGGFAGFHDHERSFDLRLGKSRGLVDSPNKFWYRKPKTLEDSFELFLQAAVAIRKSGRLGKAPIVWAWDSLASMVPRELWNKLMENKKLTMRDKLELSLATSTYFPSLAGICEELDITAVFLNQIRMKPGIVYGDPTTTPGGDAPKFYATCRIQLGATRLTKEVKEGGEIVKEQIGSQVTARVIKNKGYAPFKRAQWKFMFREDGTGYFDAVGSLVDLLITKGLIARAVRNGFYDWQGVQKSRDQIVKILTDQADGLKVLEDMLITNNIQAEHDPEAEAAAKQAAMDTAEDIAEAA